MEQRRTQRYQLQLPLQILQVGETRVKLEERTHDISSGGVCFLSAHEVEVGSRIEYLITLSGNRAPVRIRCLGTVLRSDQPAANSRFEVAMTMDRYHFVRSEEEMVISASA